MSTAVYFLKSEQPIPQNTFDFLLEFVRRNKAERILRQKIRGRAEEMLIGEILAMIALTKTFNIPAARLKISETENGKPYLEDFPDVFFNISHCEGYVACAVSDCPVGIDIQNITRFNSSVAKKICTKEELDKINKSTDKDSAFTKLWTKKEAALKMKGTGIARGDIKNCLKEAKTESIAIDNFWLSVCFQCSF